MKFYEALKECIENGKKISREDWNGKGMYVWHMPDTLLTDEDGTVRITHGYFCMLNAQGEIIIGWMASQTDLTSDKWEVVE